MGFILLPLTRVVLELNFDPQSCQSRAAIVTGCCFIVAHLVLRKTTSVPLGQNS